VQSTEDPLTSGCGAGPAIAGLAPWPEACARSGGAIRLRVLWQFGGWSHTNQPSREGWSWWDKIPILSLLGPFFSGLVEFTHTRVIPRLAPASPQVTRGW